MKQILANDIDRDNLEEKYYLHQLSSRERAISSSFKKNKNDLQSNRTKQPPFFQSKEDRVFQSKIIIDDKTPSNLQKYSTMIGYNPKLGFRKNKIDEINSILMEGMLGNLKKKAKKKQMK